MLGNWLFGAVKLNNNADPDKYGYNGYSIGSDLHADFLWADDSPGKNVMIFGANMSSSAYIENKNILVLDECSTQ